METQPKLPWRDKLGLILRCLQGNIQFMIATVLCSCGGMLFHSFTPQVIGFTVDSVLDSKAPDLPAVLLNLLPVDRMRENPAGALWTAAAAVLVLELLYCILAYFGRVTMAKASEGFMRKLRNTLYAHIEHLPFAWHTAHSTGDVIQRCTSDVEVIRQFVCHNFTEVVRTLFLIVLYLTLMLQKNLAVSWVCILFMPIVGLSSGLFYRGIGSRFEAADRAEGELTACAQENFTGVRVVRAFGREAFEVERFNQKNERFSNLWIKLGNLLSVYWASGTLLTALQVMAVIIAGTVQCVSGNLTVGGFTILVTYGSGLAWPVRSLGRVLSDMSKAGVSLDRVGAILNAPEEQDDPEAQDMALQGDIVFQNVSFGYGSQKVLEDVSFTIPAGSTFAILGGTGSGKSTLVHLLDRLYDLSEGQGSITIGGTDIRKIRRKCLRRQVGLVLQEPFLFSKSIRDNIAATRPEAAKEELRSAAVAAAVDEAIADLPQGYDTVVGERGVTLSGGQKQRVAIARMLLQNTPIMVFDDSLSAVDAETDAKIRSALQDRVKGATVILISHRVNTLMQADRILVLDSGKVSDIGTHAELISRPGIYRDIYDIQMSADDRRLLEEGGEA